MVLGHDLSAGNRTDDVRISEDVSFDTMLLRKPTLKGLKKAGFLRPSPIQLHGIPLGKCGFDLLLDAKSGTGKTAVFTVISLEKLDMSNGVQTIILAPTREIASQISSVINEIGSQYKDLNVAVVMGGLPVKDDIEKLSQNVQIVVGSPGRLRHLIQDKHIDLSAVRLLVLDEADKLLEKSFLPDINYIFSQLPQQKQVIMSSATYSEDTKTFIGKYLQKAQHVCPDSNSVLRGISQKVTIVPHNSNIVKQTKHRHEELKKILNSKQFKQCLIFCNYQVRVGELHRMLSRDKWPAEQLYGQQDQTDRLDALKTLQEYKCRILVSTDLAARGIDASNVDLVINFEPPFEWQTYLHRIGRAGRYGSYGTAISILSEGKEKTKFKETLALTNIPFNLRDLWNDEPFSLSLTDDTLDTHEEPYTVAPNNSILPKIEQKLENILWNALTAATTRSSEQCDVKPGISSFNELCDSFNMSTKTNIETFSDLMNSFQTNQEEISNNIDCCKFKHIHVANLPIDGIKYWDNIDIRYTNQLNNSQNAQPVGNVKLISHMTPNITNGDSTNEECNKNERYMIEKMEKENSKRTNNLNKALGSRLDESKTKQNMISKDSSKAFEKDMQDKRQGKFVKYNMPDKNYNSTNKNDPNNVTGRNGNIANALNTSDMTTIDPIKQALIDAGLPTGFGKVKQNKYQNRIHSYYYNRNNETINKENSKNNDIQQNPVKIQEVKKRIQKISSSKTFTRENMQAHASTTNLIESDSSSSSFKTYDKKNTSKTGNEYTYNKTTCQCKENKRVSVEQYRGKIFDNWYEQLKHRTRSIQYALYIEELRNL